MSAAEVGSGEGHLACVKDTLFKHEKALYRERVMCYDTMRRHMRRSSSASLGAHCNGLSARMQSLHGLQARWSIAPHSLRWR